MRIFINHGLVSLLVIPKSTLLRVVADQRDALLRRPVGVERDLLSIVASYIPLPHVIVIGGLRRCGKSTLMRQVIHEYYKDDDFHYITFEDERLLQFTTNDFQLLFEAQLELYGDKRAFFIDEIQAVPGFESFLRRMYESGMKFFISGSNASMLREEISTRLTGRHIDVVLKPFSFREFLVARRIEVPEPAAQTTRIRVAMKKAYDEFLVTGGMPERVLFGEPAILDAIYDDIVIKDIIVRHGITDVKPVRELYQYLVSNFCRKFTYNNLAKLLGTTSPNTIKNYIQHFEDTYFADVVTRFDFSVRRQVLAEKKFYVRDTGFVPRVSPAVTIDKGWLIENQVVSSLKHGDNLFYYSKNGECDIITRSGGKIDSAIQVTRELGPANEARELHGLLDAMQALKVDRGLIITEDQDDEIRHGDHVVPVVPAWRWALGVRPA